MKVVSRRFPVLLGLCGVIVVASAQARQDFTRTESDSMFRKLNTIVERGAKPKPAATAKPVRTSFTDREVNAYFKFNSDIMPVGVVDPRVTIVDGKQVQARALVDLDVIRKSKVRGWLDPLAYVTGRVELTAAGLLTGANGKGRLPTAVRVARRRADSGVSGAGSRELLLEVARTAAGLRPRQALRFAAEHPAARNAARHGDHHPIGAGVQFSPCPTFSRRRFSM